MQHPANKQEHLGKRHDKSEDKQPVWKGLRAARPSQHDEFQLETLEHDAVFFSLHVRRWFFFFFFELNKKEADPSLTPHSPRKTDKSIIGTARQLEGGNGEGELKKDDEKFSWDPRTLLSQEGVGVWNTFLMRLPKSKMVIFSRWALSEYHWGFYFILFFCQSAPPTPSYWFTKNMKWQACATKHIRVD